MSVSHLVAGTAAAGHRLQRSPPKEETGSWLMGPQVLRGWTRGHPESWLRAFSGEDLSTSSGKNGPELRLL